MNRTVKKIIHATERPEGVGAIVRRFVGVDGMRQFSPFLMADHFSGGEGGFPEHPHLGQETITYITKGAFAHEDFTGSKGILYAGDLQFMTAGKGVVHSEMPVRLPDGVTPAGIQLWVDLPHELKEVSPRYRDLRAYEIPEAVEQDGKLTVKVISGNSYGVESLKDLAYTPIHYYHYIMKPGSIFEQPVPENFNVFLYVTQGNGLRLSDGNTLKQNSAAFFKMDGSSIKGANPLDSDNNIEFMLVGGEVLDQHTVHYGPFVAKDQERIRRAFADYQNARNGFANLKTWKTLISGGVTEDMIQNDLNGSLELRKKAEQEYLSRKAAEHQTPIEPVKDEL
ncbi:RNA pol II transcription cofactor [Yamadazyma tenuis]|uniref:Pirin-like protein n=1 Tax=Candida tenuis (strain ATCC 10573 / BCRC 21748 / CBS 615 / JCM 9827 / NBRC 10315 / NRRL Y-1498 / VKM Y-70) TaxID=590646 RepID=G3BDN4_CANTC|nr:uncharacterized protein CANTEDRAFT_116394 [Yamadazyma tenuis ATCC 10573]EGV60345.1 hypothetical protein CANTEDRAFT_116394 [Yamadazyma tenuis ATCC 10573]WEJ94417.1 RNA pol II transcription cofactor [Yamadazyma tenuis]